MKKITSVMFAFLAFAVISNAAITADKGGEMLIVNDNSIVATDGKEATNIDYNGLKVSVPQGVKVSLSKEENGNIIIDGNDLSNVKVSNLILNSKGNTKISVSPKNNTLTVKNGENVTITNVNGKVSSIKAGQTAILVAFAKPEVKAEEKEEEAKKEEKVEKKETADKNETKAEKPSTSSTIVETNIPSFVMPSTESAANQQAALNVEETISASAPF